jgi:dipeptidyl aminopeptidase/acylaminoacyl peptidase
MSLLPLPVERKAAVPADMAKLFPQLLINANFPPAMFIHGEADTVVIVSESDCMYEKLQKAASRSMLHIVPGAEHGFLVQPERKPAPQA